MAGELLFYLDMHAHAHTRGCVLYGNRLPSTLSQACRGADLGSRHSHRRPWQVWNVAFAKFCELNGPHFDFQGCEFPPNAEKDSTDSALHDATKVPVKGVFRNGPNISNIIFHIVTRCYKNDQHQLQFRIQILQ